jgi:hypothetical protein
MSNLEGRLNKIENVDRKRDTLLERDINSSVAKYFKGLVILDGYEYVTSAGDSGEIDGVVVGTDEDGKNCIVFIETTNDMNKKYKDAQNQMSRTISHWLCLKEFINNADEENEQKFKNDLEKFQVRNYQDYYIRCAFGANFFDNSIVPQFKDFKGRKWLKVVKIHDHSYEVTRQT